MHRPCHECHIFVNNPFYSIALVIGSKPGRVAFSALEYALCNANFDFSSKKMKGALDRLRMPVGYILGKATEEKEATLKGAMESPFAVYDRFGPYSFLEREDALYDLPKTATDLLAKPVWMEKVDNVWREATWASELYKYMSKL